MARQVRQNAVRWALGPVLAAALAHAEVSETALTLGHETAVVSEVRRASFSRGDQELVLTGIPPEAELATLMLRMRRIPLALLGWERQHVAAADPLPLRITPAGVSRSGGGDGVVADAVVCRVRMPLASERSYTAQYSLPGVGWAVSYQIYLRGNPRSLEASIALDLVGQLEVDNQTGRAFSNALVRITGADPVAVAAAQPLPGELMLTELPVTDLWRTETRERPVEQNYPLPRRLDLPAYTRTKAVFIESQRIAAQRVYVMDARLFPVSESERRRSLTQELVFENSAANRLGWALPPGPVAVYRGVIQRRAITEGRLPATLIGQAIRLDLGEEPEVVGNRFRASSTEVEPGEVEEVIRLSVENRQRRPVTIQIREAPTGSRSWTLVSAGGDYELIDRVLNMEFDLAAGATRSIDVRYRFSDPQIATRPPATAIE
jgi:hypothetical protein